MEPESAAPARYSSSFVQFVGGVNLGPDSQGFGPNIAEVVVYGHHQ